MLVHHSRNSAQKQWEETLVLALGGMARILRAHLPTLVPMPGFSQVSQPKKLYGSCCSETEKVRCWLCALTMLRYHWQGKLFLGLIAIRQSCFSHSLEQFASSLYLASLCISSLRPSGYSLAAVHADTKDTTSAAAAAILLKA